MRCLGIRVTTLDILEGNICAAVCTYERGERVWHRLGLKIVGSAEECDRTASTFLNQNSVFPRF